MKLQNLIDTMYVQERNDNTDEQCAACKRSMGQARQNAQKALVFR